MLWKLCQWCTVGVAECCLCWISLGAYQSCVSLLLAEPANHPCFILINIKIDILCRTVLIFHIQCNCEWWCLTIKIKKFSVCRCFWIWGWLLQLLTWNEGYSPKNYPRVWNTPMAQLEEYFIPRGNFLWNTPEWKVDNWHIIPKNLFIV